MVQAYRAIGGATQWNQFHGRSSNGIGHGRGGRGFDRGANADGFRQPTERELDVQGQPVGHLQADSLPGGGEALGLEACPLSR
jgi:hypothetical protein